MKTPTPKMNFSQQSSQGSTADFSSSEKSDEKKQKLLFKENYALGHVLKDSYQIGPGELRKCRHLETNVMRQVQVINKAKLDQTELEKLNDDLDLRCNLNHVNI